MAILLGILATADMNPEVKQWALAMLDSTNKRIQDVTISEEEEFLRR